MVKYNVLRAFRVCFISLLDDGRNLHWALGYNMKEALLMALLGELDDNIKYFII